MWIGALVAVGVAFGTKLDSAFAEEGRTGSGTRAFVAVIAACGLFIGSGPVAYWIGRRPWLIALPAIGLALLGLGAAFAYVT